MPKIQPRRVFLAFLGSSLALAGSQAQAQFPIGTGPSVVVTSPTVVTSTAYPSVVTMPTTRVYETRGMARRSLRQANRYTVSRPVYGDRVGVGFAPYSDYYFPGTEPLGGRRAIVAAPVVASPVTVVRPTTIVTTPTILSPQPIYSVVRPR